MKPGKIKYLKGAVHIHTLYSDGSGDINLISKAAKKAGLDWIIITDHNCMMQKEGIYNGVHVFTCEEVSPLAANHCLAFNLNKSLDADENPEINLNNIHNAGGFAFMAHPDESFERKNSVHVLRWTNKELTADGVEIWNRFSDWADNMCDKNFFTLAYAYLFRDRLIKGPHKETLEYWDKINSERSDIYPAICGVDAHALKMKKYGVNVTIFPYSYFFSTLTNFIPAPVETFEDFEKYKQHVINSIKTGKNIIVDRKIFPENPDIFIENNNKTVLVGDSVSLDENTFYNIIAPKKSFIRIVKDGKTVNEYSGNMVSYKISEKGKYRTEIYVNNRPWVFSNPVIVK